MVAMICGCSFLISSATAAESIHFRPSMPLVSLPCRIRSMITPALSSPSALVSTERMYSLESSDMPVCCSASRTNSCKTSSTCSRVTFFNAAIATPIFWTSRGPRNLNTCAASSSPIDISRSALVITPSALSGHPVFHDGCNDLRSLTRDIAREFQVPLIFVFRIFQREGLEVGLDLDQSAVALRSRNTVEQQRLFGRRQCGGGGLGRRESAAQRGLHHHEVDEQGDRADAEVGRDLFGERQHFRRAPPRQVRVRIGLGGERAVDDVDRVAARRVEAHRVL